MENKEINVVFKNVLKTFVAEMLNPCESFVDEIESCETYGDLKDLLEENVDSIFQSLGGDSSCSDCEDKDDRISELEDSVEDLSDDNERMESDLAIAYVPQTLNDEYKLEAFKKSVDKFSVSEIESLLS